MIVWQGNELEKNRFGIYAIYANEKMLYIGSTRTTFRERLSKHNSEIKEKAETNDFYSYLSYNQDKMSFSMRPLIIFDYLKTKKEITAESCGWMELALISVFRPRFNVKGKKENFIFPH